MAMIEWNESYVIVGSGYYNVYEKPDKKSRIVTQLTTGDGFSASGGTAVKKNDFHLVYAKGAKGWMEDDDTGFITAYEARQRRRQAVVDEISGLTKRINELALELHGSDPNGD